MSFFFFNDTATTEIYTLSLHDALPIWTEGALQTTRGALALSMGLPANVPYDIATPPDTTLPLGILDSVDTLIDRAVRDRKSTRLNSSHLVISYAVFCLKKKKKTHR